MNLDPIVDFVKMSPDERNSYLRIRLEQEREALFEAWARSDYLSVTDMLALAPEFQIEIVAHVCGSVKKGLPMGSKTFMIEPTGSPVMLEAGSSRNKRRYVEIKKAISMPANRALQALHMYGENSYRVTMKGKLREVLPPELKKLRDPLKKSTKSDK